MYIYTSMYYNLYKTDYSNLKKLTNRRQAKKLIVYFDTIIDLSLKCEHVLQELLLMFYPASIFSYVELY